MIAFVCEKFKSACRDDKLVKSNLRNQPGKASRFRGTQRTLLQTFEPHSPEEISRINCGTSCREYLVAT